MCVDSVPTDSFFQIVAKFGGLGLREIYFTQRIMESSVSSEKELLVTLYSWQNWEPDYRRIRRLGTKRRPSFNLHRNDSQTMLVGTERVSQSENWHCLLAVIPNDTAVIIKPRPKIYVLLVPKDHISFRGFKVTIQIQRCGTEHV